jgi:hypothetical protein
MPGLPLLCALELKAAMALTFTPSAIGSGG